MIVKIILIFLLIFNIKLYADDDTYVLEAFLKLTVTGEVVLSDEKNYYRTIKLEGSWKDNLGQIGTTIASGRVQTEAENLSIEVITKSVDENGDKFWAFVKRRIGDLDSGGGGTLEYIDGTGKYKALIGKKCNYATRYIGNRNFHIQKCKFSKELIARLKKN